MYGVVQKGDAVAKYSTKDFRYHQAQRGSHRPTKNGRLQRRMRVSGVASVTAVDVSVAVRAVAVVVIVTHRSHSTRVE